jgi:citrate lyase beta subunit
MAQSYRDFLKQVRNNILIETDIKIADIEDATQLARWQAYREQLRTFFDDKPESYNFVGFTWPDSPENIDALLEKAAEGDAGAIALVAQKGL